MGSPPQIQPALIIAREVRHGNLPVLQRFFLMSRGVGSAGGKAMVARFDGSASR
jgi:hypothetical protein